MKELIIIQTTTPDYRKAFFDAIRSELGAKFKLYRGSQYFEKTVVTDTNIKAIDCRNHFILGRRFLFQTGIWGVTFSKAVLVLEMNPRIISNWILLLLRRLAGRQTVLWGHAWPRKGQQSKSDRLRHLMRKLASAIITYTEKQQIELQEYMPHKMIYAAPNAVFSKSLMHYQSNTQDPTNLIYVGRLTGLKKPAFLVHAFHQGLLYFPVDMDLLIIGSGDEEESLAKYIEKHNLSSRIKLMGHISDIERLSDLYAQSFLSVSPGYVGLSVTQSFGFGVPMLVSRDENHSPEIEAVKDQINALYFDTDDEVSFRESVLKALKEKEHWVNKRQEIQAFCREKYSVEAMAQVFTNLVKMYDA